MAILSAEDVAVSPVAYERDQYRSRPGQEDLTPAECVELPTHRCFTRTTKPHEDRWPFDDRCTEAGAADSA